MKKNFKQNLGQITFLIYYSHHNFCIITKLLKHYINKSYYYEIFLKMRYLLFLITPK